MAKKIVKPTSAEKSIILRRLKNKYPQMFKGSKVKKDYAKGFPGTKKAKKKATNKRSSHITSALKNAGLSQSDIDRLRGKKK